MNNLAKYFRYLDRLRESGKTNMYGAALYLERDMHLGPERSSNVLRLWMKTFDPAKPAKERAENAVAKG